MDKFQGRKNDKSNKAIPMANIIISILSNLRPARRLAAIPSYLSDCATTRKAQLARRWAREGSKFLLQNLYRFIVPSLYRVELAQIPLDAEKARINPIKPRFDMVKAVVVVNKPNNDEEGRDTDRKQQLQVCQCNLQRLVAATESVSA
jgi:hypothetical protein